MSNVKRILGSRVVLSLATTLLYVLAFIPLYNLVWRFVIALSIVPILVVASEFGLWGGLVAGLTFIPLDWFLLWVRESDVSFLGANFWATHVVFLSVGVIVGYLYDVRTQLKKELLEREQAEEELRKHRDHLEELVGERTAELKRASEQFQQELAERKRAEEALQELMKKTEQAKEEWESTADSLPELVCLVDDRGRIIRANRIVETWNLGRVVEVRGRGAHELLHPGCTDVTCYLDAFWKQAWAEAMQGQLAQCEAYDEILKRHILVRVQPLKGEAIGSTVVVVQDVTERKRAEEALKEYSERLEEMVEKRIAELKTINEQLRLEIAERQRAEKALRDEKALVDALMDNITDSIYFKDRQCCLTRVSRKMMRDLNLDEMSQVIGKTDVDLFGEEFGRKTLAEDQRIMATGEPLMGLIESRQLGDGQINWTLTTKVPLRDASGQIVGLAGITREINELKRAEEALRESEEKYRTILENIEDGYYEVDLAGNLTFFNDSLCRLYEYPEDELMGMNYRQYMDGKTAKMAYRTFNEVYRTGKPSEAFDWEVIRKSGARRFVETSVTRMMDSAGEPVGFRGIVRDITERKRAEKALKESEERYRNLFENANDLIQSVAPDGSFVYVNRAWRETLGYGEEEIAGLSMTDVVHPDNLAHCMNVFQRAMSGESVDKVEAVFVAKDGKRVTVEGNADCRFVDGRPVYTQGIFRDITERKRAEETLMRRAIQLATLNRIGRHVASILDQQKLLQDAVDAVREDLGYLQAAVLLVDEEASELYVTVATDKFWKVIPDGYRQSMGKGAIGMAAETKETVLVCDAAGDSRVYRAGVWLSPSSLSVPIGIGGQVIGILEVEANVPNAFDENDQATLEIMADQIAIAIENARLYEEIEERRMYLEGVLRAAPDAIVALDARHHVMEWNLGAQKLFGYSREEVIDRDIDDLVSREDVFEEAVGFTRVVTGGEDIPPMETVRYRKDGSPVDVIVAGSPILVRNELIGVVGVYTDITKRKRAEEALRVSEERFALAVQGSNDGIWDWDLQNNSLYWSPRLKELLGYADDELDIDFDTFDSLLHPDDKGRVGEAIEAHLKSGGLYDVEQRLRTKSGEYRWFRARGQALWDEDGQPVRMLGFTTDITERKRAEEQLKRYAVELEQANEEVKQFAYIVSHDLRAPLVNLKGFSAELHFALEAIDSVMETALPHLDKKQRRDVTLALKEDVPEALGFINSSVTHMDHFISALLKLSRLGRRELHPEPVDVEALIQASLESLAHQIEERQAEVRVGPLPRVIADPTALEQIVGNILTNAVKYLDPDRPGEIEITAELGRDETTFRIRDNGRGIAEEDMDKVFAPFRRIGRQDVPGEGMGLPYVQALVRRHGGRIWCESELGVGTTFNFTIPNHIAEGDDHV